MADTETVPGWLAELNAKYGEPRIARPVAVDLGDRKRQCWVWFPGGENHNLGIDQAGDRWIVRAARPGGNGELTVYGKDRPSDAVIRSVLVAAGLLSDLSRGFLLDPYTSHEATCPDCFGIVSVSGDSVFLADSDTGIPLGHEATLGDLIDAASTHKCDEGEK